MNRTDRRDAAWGLFFITPFLLVAVIFLIIPIGYSLYLSVRETTLYSSWFDQFATMEFVGLRNYSELLHDPVVWYALIATGLYALLLIPAMIAASLALALALSTKLRGFSFFRGAFFLPHVFDVFVVGVIWLLLYNPQGGPFAALFRLFGVDWFTKNGFVDNPATVLPSIAFSMILKSMGFGMVVFLAALNNIPESIFEAADIDGATGWQKLWRVTLPLLRPIILFLTVTGLVGVLNAFAEFYALTRATGGQSTTFMGHTVQAARVAGFHLYRLFYESYYGHAAALSFILLGFTLVITFINFRVLGRDRTA